MVRKESIIGCSKRVACKALLEGCVLLDVILCSSQGFMPFQQRLGALRIQWRVSKSSTITRDLQKFECTTDLRRQCLL